MYIKYTIAKAHEYKHFAQQELLAKIIFFKVKNIFPNVYQQPKAQMIAKSKSKLKYLHRKTLK